MFNDRRRLSMQETAQGRGGSRHPQRQRRSEQIAALYAREAATIRRIASRQANVPADVLDDACQTAWAQLCSHDEVDVARQAAVIGWLVVTATRAAWRYSRVRERPMATDPDTHLAGEERIQARARSTDPVDVVVRRDDARTRLVVLDARQRRMIALQAAGFTYEEISARTGATRRTVERQLLSARRKLAVAERTGERSEAR
jgi:RNA polymerase sigma factor (sigma-70 family)